VAAGLEALVTDGGVLMVYMIFIQGLMIDISR